MKIFIILYGLLLVIFGIISMVKDMKEFDTSDTNDMINDVVGKENVNKFFDLTGIISSTICSIYNLFIISKFRDNKYIIMISLILIAMNYVYFYIVTKRKSIFKKDKIDIIFSLIQIIYILITMYYYILK